MRRLLDPLNDIRKGPLADDTTQKFIKELKTASFLGDHIKQHVN